jgi:hypothetical protein
MSDDNRKTRDHHTIVNRVVHLRKRVTPRILIIPSAISLATSSPNLSSIYASIISIPALMPKDVQTFPSCTHRASSTH